MEMRTARSLADVHGLDERHTRRRASWMRRLLVRGWRLAGMPARRLVMARAARREMRELDRLDERMLADIGLTRSRVGRCVAHFPRDGHHRR